MALFVGDDGDGSGELGNISLGFEVVYAGMGKLGVMGVRGRRFSGAARVVAERLRRRRRVCGFMVAGLWMDLLAGRCWENGEMRT